MNYEEAINYLLNIPKFSRKTGLDNVRYALSLMGNLQKNLKYIHIAGTNGKGSVCAFINQILIEDNKKVGLFTSPHLEKINERFKIDGKDIDDEKFLDNFIIVYNIVKEMQKNGYEHLSFFEFLFVMSVLIFYNEKVDYVVLETGLGGRLDATNVVDSEISVITSVSFDHMEFLGNTLTKIASEKAGIIKTNKPIIYLSKNDEIRKAIEIIANQKNAILYPILKNSYKFIKRENGNIYFEFENQKMVINMNGIYQVENASIAIKTVKTLISNIDENIIKKGLLNTKWSGRLEEIEKNIFVDGAHNEDGVKGFVDSINMFYKDKNKILLFAVSSDKDYKSMIKILCENIKFKEIYITKYTNKRTENLNKIYEIFKKYVMQDIKKYDKVEEAFFDAKKNVDSENLLFCIGSLYLVGDIGRFVKE